jgi:hypothetical protein
MEKKVVMMMEDDIEEGRINRSVEPQTGLISNQILCARVLCSRSPEGQQDLASTCAT